MTIIHLLFEARSDVDLCNSLEDDVVDRTKYQEYDGTIVVYWHYTHPVLRFYVKNDEGISARTDAYFQKPLTKSDLKLTKELGKIGKVLTKAVMALPATSEVAITFDVLAVLPRLLYDVEELQDDIVKIIATTLGWENPLVLIALQGFPERLPVLLPGLNALDLTVYDEVRARHEEAETALRHEREQELEEYMSKDNL